MKNTPSTLAFTKNNANITTNGVLMSMQISYLLHRRGKEKGRNGLK